MSERLIRLGYHAERYFATLDEYTKRDEVSFAMGFLGISVADPKESEFNAWVAGEECGMDYEIEKEDKDE